MIQSFIKSNSSYLIINATRRFQLYVHSLQQTQTDVIPDVNFESIANRYKSSLRGTSLHNLKIYRGIIIITVQMIYKENYKSHRVYNTVVMW